VTEAIDQAIDQGHDGIALGHRQRTVRAEVVLHVDHQEHVGFAGFDRFAHAFPIAGVHPNALGPHDPMARQGPQRLYRRRHERHAACEGREIRLHGRAG
jgi:hypothetical protein